MHTTHHQDPGAVAPIHPQAGTQHHHGAHAAHGADGAMRRLKQLLLLLCVAQLMVILDITAVNVAMPDMAKGLNIAGGDVGWTITSYSLIFGSLLLLGGRAADLLGRRRMFLSGLGLFVTASLAAALAGSAATLFTARAGQGLGAALLSPAALSILMSTFPRWPPGAPSAVRARPSGCCSVVSSPSCSAGRRSSSSTCPSASRWPLQRAG
jgi:sugar phosphate permease